MSSLLLFTLVFCSQLMAAFNTPLPPPSYGDKVSILSIDGGGIRGIIPATVLIHLDNALKAKDPTSSLADYFDVISGTSTGGLMSLMLSAPSSPGSNTPLFTPSEVVNFYKTYGPDIFKLRPIWDLTKCPKYDGKFLANKARELLKETRLNQTLTNVVIPSFDEQKIYPVIFSSFKLKTEAYLNAKLSDICVATSAAPTLLPSHQFENDGVQFDLVDGAIAANNPAMAAVSEVIQEHHAEKEILLLSLGTGIPKAKDKLGDDNDDDSCLLRWLGEHSDTISEVISKTDMTHSYLATIFPGLFPAENYLRIEEYNLDPSMGAVDNTTEENMDSLVKVGNALLDKKAKRMNVNTFVTFKLHQTNAMALDMLAEKLYAERQLRLKRKSMEKGGRSFTETI
ncbi:Acyl transferase/acyl hydrolase/lysophospholipase [Vigna unguiculata]|uniref:Patatin n=1 Tax=Vigna unguiculata TaxID=3917 RepID=A0A4D6MTR0_VIGUN|nr:Acyl transferase/acyl hydrolase/lysophospholipase [Vigna unguiculata]